MKHILHEMKLAVDHDGGELFEPRFASHVPFVICPHLISEKVQVQNNLEEGSRESNACHGCQKAHMWFLATGPCFHLRRWTKRTSASFPGSEMTVEYASPHSGNEDLWPNSSTISLAEFVIGHGNAKFWRHQRQQSFRWMSSSIRYSSIKNMSADQRLGKRWN